MIRPRLILIGIAAVMLCGSLSAAWYDDYEAGVAAARKQDWRTVIEKMNTALATKPNEGRERTYGNVFVQYRPYYYRGIAYFELGDFKRSISDLERTKGPGDFSLGTSDSYIRRAEARLAEVTATPTPPPTPPPATPTPRPTLPVVTPTPGPAITPVVVPPTPPPFVDSTSLRESRARAQNLLAQAEDRRAQAQQARADSLARAEFSRGMTHLSRARTLGARANTPGEWTAAANEAEAARLNFERAFERANAPVEDVLADTRRRVRNALEAYFEGRFSDAASQFNRLSAEQSNNALIWAFYGASLYSSYYIGGQRDAAARAAAEGAFRRAKALQLKELDSGYFSPRIRRFYASVR